MKTQKREKSVFSTLLKTLAVVAIAAFCVFVKSQNIYAEDHTCSNPNNCSDFSLQVYRCPTAGCDEDFAISIAAGTANSYLLDSNSRLSSGDALMVAIKFVPKQHDNLWPRTIVDTVTYDTNYFETVKTCGRRKNELCAYTVLSELPSYKGVSDYKTTITNANEGSIVQQIQANDEYSEDIKDPGLIGFFQLNAKTGIAPGAQTTLAFNDATPTNMVLSNVTTKFPYKKTDYTINFVGNSASTDATLSALSVKSSDNTITYPLTPEFNATTAATPRNTFSTIVPSSASSVNIHATANDNNAQDIKLFNGEWTDQQVSNDTDASKSIVSGSTVPIVGIGNKTLATGDNKFTIAVTSQSGNIQNEIVSIYKLSSVDTLDSLGVDNYSFTSSFSPSTTNYTINDIPYATKNLSITASLTTDKATKTGDGAWPLTPDTTAARAYSRNITVYPEECKYVSNNSYGNAVVQGASCNPKTYKITANRVAASIDATLKLLSASYVHTTGSSATSDTLIPSSEAGKTINLGPIAYGATSITFTATANQANAKRITLKANSGTENPMSVTGSPISGTASCALNVGDNTCTIKVTAEDGTSVETYIITAHRRSNDASLKTFTVAPSQNPNGNTLQPTFPSSSNDTYSMLYNETADTFAVTATVNDTNKTQSILMTGPGDVSGQSTTGNTLSRSFNTSGSRTDADTVAVVVTAEDGNTRTYTVNLTREASNDASLKEIKVTTSNGTTSNTQTIAPVANTYSYVIDVDPDVTTITGVTAATTSDYGSVSASDISYDETLQFGTGDTTHNKITVKGTPESGNKSQYNITVNRKKYSIAGASKIEVRYGTETTWTEVSGVSASQDGTFNLRVKDVNPVPNNVNSMAIRVTAAGPEATITGDGSKSLIANQNNEFTITVAAQDNSATRTYKLNVWRDGSSNTDITDLKIRKSASEIYSPSIQGDDEQGRTVYTLSVPYNVDKILESEVQVTTADGYASVTRSGQLPLNAGTPADYAFTVTSQSGATKNYIVRITRQLNNQSGASVIKLRLSDESSATRAWYPGTNDRSYTFNIPYNKSSYHLEASIPAGAYLSNEEGYIDSDEELTIDDSGTSVYKIKVISQDGESNTEYTITVVRELSADVSLEDLNLTYTNGDTQVQVQTISGFTPTKNSYYLTVPGGTTQITIGAELHDKRGKFVSTDSNANYSATVDLNYDLNPISFDVKAENGTTTQTYTINVTRQRKTNPYIQSILINGNDLSTYLPDGVSYDGARAGGTYEYTLKNFPNSTSSLTFDAIMVDAPSGSEPGASSTLVSNNQALPQNVGIKTLHYGGAANLDNKIEIYGIAHDGTTKQKYILHVYRDPSADTRVSDAADAVQVFWDGTWHNATWSQEELAYVITVPNSVSKVNSSNVQAKPKEAPTNGAAGTASYDPEVTLITDDPSYGNVNTYGFTITAENGKTQHYDMKITKEKSDNAALSELTVEDDRGNSIGSFNPSFAPGKYAYTVTVGKSVDEIYIDALAAEGHANISGNGGPFTVDGVDDVFTITVIPENGDTTKKKEYTITIVREKSDDATLSQFKVTDLEGNAYEMTPAFSSSVSNITYQVTIPGEEDRVLLEYVGSTNLAEGVQQQIVYTVTPDTDPNEYNIPTGGNRTIGVRVTAENGTTEKTYNVQVNRTKRNNALLDSLTYTFNGGTAQSVDLESCVFANDEYTCDIGQLASTGASGVTLGAHAADQQAQISGDVSTPLTISTGRNTYTITVTAEDGTTTQTYKVNLLKKPSEEAKLTSLGVKDGNGWEPNFNSETYQYAVWMNNEDKETFSSSDITMTQASNRATKILDEPISLTVGADNWYTITMKPEACEEQYADLVALNIVNCTDNIKTYSINVKRPASTNSYLDDVDVDQDSRLSPNFTRLGNNYSITIAYGGNSFEITATPERETSTVTDNAGNVFNAANNYTNTVYFNDLTDGAYRITVTPESGENPRYYNFTVAIARSDDNKLSKLQVFKDNTEVALSPDFDPTHNTYTIPDITNDVTELLVQASENNPDSSYRYIYQNNEVCGEVASCKITIDPSKTMQTIKVEVTPADGSAARTYRIDFNIKKDNNADLASLTVAAPGALDSSFVADDTEYTVTGLTYENVTGPIALKFRTSDPDAKVSVNGGVQQSCAVECTTNLNFDLTDKNAQVINTSIKVIAEDNTEKTYTVSATRAAAIASSDPTLAGLSVTGSTLSPDFTPDHEDYDIGEIPYSQSSVEVNIRPNNEEAHVFVNGNEITVTGGVGVTTVNAPQTNAEQTVTIRVLAGNNVDDKIYTITFHKNGSTDTSLSRLEFTNGTLSPAYDPEQKTYTLTLGEDQTTSIIAVPTDPNTTMSFGTPSNMKTLDSGREMGVTGLTDTVNVRQLVIMSENGDIDTLTITIERITGEDKITSVAYGHNITARTVEVTGEVAKYGYITSVADRDIGEKAADGTYPDYDNSPSGSMTVELLASQLDNQRANLHFYKPALDENGIFLGKGVEITSDEVIGTGTVITLEVDNILRDQVIVIIKGDVNGDGLINYKDRGKIINHNAADGTKLADGSLALIAADINDDGVINYKDRGKVINHTAADGTRIDYGAMLTSGGAPPGS